MQARNRPFRAVLDGRWAPTILGLLRALRVSGAQSPVKSPMGLFDHIYKSGRIGAKALDELVYVTQSGTFQKPLLIRDPLTACSQYGVGGHHGGGGKGSSQFRELPGVDVGSLRVMQR